MRNFKNYAEAGASKMPRQQELSLSEYMMLRHMADDSDDGLYMAVTMAYQAGFEAGTRYKRRVASRKEN